MEPPIFLGESREQLNGMAKDKRYIWAQWKGWIKMLRYQEAKYDLRVKRFVYFDCVANFSADRPICIPSVSHNLVNLITRHLSQKHRSLYIYQTHILRFHSKSLYIIYPICSSKEAVIVKVCDTKELCATITGTRGWVLISYDCACAVSCSTSAMIPYTCCFIPSSVYWKYCSWYCCLVASSFVLHAT